MGRVFAQCSTSQTAHTSSRIFPWMKRMSGPSSTVSVFASAFTAACRRRRVLRCRTPCARACPVELDGTQPSNDDAPSPWDALCGNVLSCEMLFHVYNSLTLEMRSSCHLELCEDDGATGHTLDLALAAAHAYGAAFARAARVDPRRKGKVASSKGTLSK